MTQPAKIRNLIDYFSEIRKRPGMYLGTNTITKLHDHLQGCQMAYWCNDIANPVDKNFFDNFNEFVYYYYGVTSNERWKGVILQQSFGNEQKALETFFELFDLFVDNHKPKDTKSIVLALFDKLVFEQGKMKEELGTAFPSVLEETIELIKDHALTNMKYDYDFILEQLNEKAEDVSELRRLLDELEMRQPNS